MNTGRADFIDAVFAKYPCSNNSPCAVEYCLRINCCEYKDMMDLMIGQISKTDYHTVKNSLTTLYTEGEEP